MQLVQFMEAQREKKNKLLIRFVPFCEQFTAIRTGNVSRVETRNIFVEMKQWNDENIFFSAAVCKWKRLFYFRNVDK